MAVSQLLPLRETCDYRIAELHGAGALASPQWRRLRRLLNDFVFLAVKITCTERALSNGNVHAKDLDATLRRLDNRRDTFARLKNNIQRHAEIIELSLHVVPLLHANDRYDQSLKLDLLWLAHMCLSHIPRYHAVFTMVYGGNSTAATESPAELVG